MSEQQDKQKAIEVPDFVGARMFLVNDQMGNVLAHFDTLPAAVEHAETAVEEYQLSAGDGGWSGDGDIEVLQVVKRWSLLPIPTPEGEEPDTEWADLLEVELPALLNPITKEQVEAAVREAFNPDNEDTPILASNAEIDAVVQAALKHLTPSPVPEGDHSTETPG